MSTTSSDQELVSAATAGDQDAFAALYDRYADRVHTFAYSRLRDPADAADALQTTFVTAYRKLDQLDDGAKFRSWVFSIARTTIIDIARARGRHAAATPDDELTDVAADQRPPERDLEAEESGKLLWQAAAGLQPRDQELLELHLREGLDGADLADAMNVEPSHVYVMVKRLKERLGTAVGSLLVARRGADDCHELRQLLSDWDGRFSLDVRAKVTRHVESCETCQETRRAAVAWESIASAMPSFPAPTTTRALVLADVNAIVRASRGFGGVSQGVMAAFTVVATITMTVGVVALPVLQRDPTPATVETAGLVIDDDTSTTVQADENDAGEDDAEVAGETETSTTTTTTTTAAPADEATPVTATTLAPTPTTTAPPPPPPAIAPAPTTQAPTTIVIGPPPTTAAPTTTTAPTTTAAPATTTTAAPTTTTTLPPAGELNIDVAGLDFGTTDTSLTFTITNGGDGPLSWATALPPGETRFVVSAAKGVLAAGGSEIITVTFDRAGTPEGDPTSSISITSDGGDDTVPLSAAVDIAPVVVVDAPAELWEDAGACQGGADPTRPVQAVATITITDDSLPLTVDAGIDGDLQTLLPDPNDPTKYALDVGPDLPAGIATIDVIAVDARGNQTERNVGVTVNPCPG
ncbi:MAG: sigma-70 family RNA polymerase sigma factor [Actinomycetota bacterium]